MKKRRKEIKDKEGLYALYLSIVQDIGKEKYDMILEKYFNNEFDVEDEDDINKLIYIVINVIS